MAELLGLPELHVVGCLWKVWSWADQNTVDGNAICVTDVTLERYTGVTGFAYAMREVGWLKGENGALCLPNFEEHNGQTAKKRAQTQVRVAKHRNAPSVTKALPEKRREEKRLNTLTTSYEVVSTVPCSKQEPVAYAEGSYATAGGKEVQIEQRHVDRWVKTYGDRVDVRHELAKIQAYLVANPQKRPRNAGGVVKFITNWLNRTDERERRDARASPAAPTPAVSRVVSPLEALRPKNGASNGPGGF